MAENHCQDSYDMMTRKSLESLPIFVPILWTTRFGVLNQAVQCIPEHDGKSFVQTQEGKSVVSQKLAEACDGLVDGASRKY